MRPDDACDAAYGIRAATLADRPMLSRWRADPEVAHWWGGGDTFDAEGLADPRLARWIVSCGGTPFAYLQDYDVHGWPDHHFADLPAPSRGIDQFIGSPAMRDRGHGARMVAAHLRRLVAAGARVVATDPHPDNARAIACYRRAGFHVAGPARDSAWGRILPMHAGPDASRATR